MEGTLGVGEGEAGRNCELVSVGGADVVQPMSREVERVEEVGNQGWEDEQVGRQGRGWQL